jgi:hypothetical protein
LPAGAALFSAIVPVQATDKKPNVVVCGDDLGYWNVSAYKPRHDELQDDPAFPPSFLFESGKL